MVSDTVLTGRTPPPAETRVDSTVGFRLIRRIGSGNRAEVFLAKPAAGGADSPPIALKVFRSEAERAGIGREVRALMTARQAALPELDDVATTADGRLCLVLGYLPGLALDRLLTVRGRITAGEIVTIAATVTASLQALHEVGLSQARVRPARVRFDASGRPVLLGLSTLVELPSGAAGVALRRDAVTGLTGFLGNLLAYLDLDDPGTPSAPDLLAVFSAATVARPMPASLAGLEAALFEWAAACPVGQATGMTPASRGARLAAALPVPRLATVAATDHVAEPVAARTVRPGGSRADGVFAQLRTTLRRRAIISVRPGAMLRATAGEAVRTALGAAAAWVRRCLQRVGASPAAGRRPLLLGIGLVTILSIGGLAAVSAIPSNSAAGSGRGSDIGALPSRAPQNGSGGGGAEASNAPAEPDDSGVLLGDDPAAAALVLLSRREVCLAEASVLCLERVDQPGSVAMAADGYLIRNLTGEPPGAPDRGAAAESLTAEVREHTGNSALVELGPGSGVNAQPAAALMIKGEAGWRLRELFDY
jgi:hypothetical protein